MTTVEAHKNLFIELYNKYITREGSKELLEWLCNSDFFEAPASTRFHLSKEGGLCHHSIHVYNRLRDLSMMENRFQARNMNEWTPYSEETIAICALLHDLCKVNFYTVEMRNKKNEYGQWVKEPFYTVQDQFPMGHGEKSLYIISRYMRLTDEEAIAIRWHMGFSDSAFKGGDQSVGNAFNVCPLAVLLHSADLMASHIDESETRL